MRDRALQALDLVALDPVAACEADPKASGLRSARSTADARGQCHTVLSPRAGAEWVLEGEMTSCLDTISHDWLQAHVPMDTTSLQTWLKAGCRDKTVLEPTEDGTPQGGVIAPVLAHLAVDGLERTLREHYPQASARSRTATVNLVRYADDCLSTGSSQERLEQDVTPLVEPFMHARGLELSQEKTSITPVKNGVDVLGHTVRQDNSPVLVKPSKTNVTAFIHTGRTVITGPAQATAGTLRRQRNPLMRGGAHAHQHVSSKQTCVKVDHAICRTLWRGAPRRHPKTPKRWVQATYFQHIAGKNWLCCGEGKGQQGTPHRVQ